MGQAQWRRNTNMQFLSGEGCCWWCVEVAGENKLYLAEVIDSNNLKGFTLSLLRCTTSNTQHFLRGRRCKVKLEKRLIEVLGVFHQT